jgi:hypothetical protein
MATNKRYYYEVLGVIGNASDDEQNVRTARPFCHVERSRDIFYFSPVLS